MKLSKVYFLVLLSVMGLFSLQMVVAQGIERVIISTRGDFQLVVRVNAGASVILNDKGEIMDYFTHGHGRDDDRNGGRYGELSNDRFDERMSNMDGIEFSYNRDGRLERLGKVTFNYYDGLIDSDNVRGKLRSVGGVGLSYADSLVDPEYMKGKLKRIGNMSVSYYESLIDEEYIQGKIKRVGSVDFKYFDSLFDSQNLLGRLKSGQMSFVVGGMKVRIKDVR